MSLPIDVLIEIAKKCDDRTLINFATTRKELFEKLQEELHWRRKLKMSDAGNYFAKSHEQHYEIDVTYLKKMDYWKMDLLPFLHRKLYKGDIYIWKDGDVTIYNGGNETICTSKIRAYNKILVEPYHLIHPNFKVSRREFTPEYWTKLSVKNFYPYLIWFADDILEEIYNRLDRGTCELILDGKKWTIVYGDLEKMPFAEFKRHPWHLYEPLEKMGEQITPTERIYFVQTIKIT